MFFKCEIYKSSLEYSSLYNFKTCSSVIYVLPKVLQESFLAHLLSSALADPYHFLLLLVTKLDECMEDTNIMFWKPPSHQKLYRLLPSTPCNSFSISILLKRRCFISLKKSLQRQRKVYMSSESQLAICCISAASCTSPLTCSV